ncbi:MAG: fasciclin domain-containing protein [Caulobacter sp.]|nr:fasciclin domain-containing protein [Caulobacter sp.]
MNTNRLMGAAAIAALLGSTALAQTPSPTAESPRPAAVAPTPPITAPDAVPPPASSIVTPPATTPAPVAPAAPTTPVVARGDIIETLKADGHFTTFLKALEAANMTKVLKTNKNLTVFAPTDAAFAALPAGELDRLMKSPAELQKLLTYHVINAPVAAAKIKGAKGGVKTVAGPELMLDGSGATLLANTATITQTDVMATNGTLHVVDQVLSLKAAPSVAATTGATSDAAATAPAAPATPSPAAPPEAAPAPTPPTEAEPEVPEAPKTPVEPNR